MIGPNISMNLFTGKEMKLAVEKVSNTFPLTKEKTKLDLLDKLQAVALETSLMKSKRESNEGQLRYHALYSSGTISESSSFQNLASILGNWKSSQSMRGNRMNRNSTTYWAVWKWSRAVNCPSSPWPGNNGFLSFPFDAIRFTRHSRSQHEAEGVSVGGRAARHFPERSVCWTDRRRRVGHVGKTPDPGNTFGRHPSAGQRLSANDSLDSAWQTVALPHKQRTR